MIEVVKDFLTQLSTAYAHVLLPCCTTHLDLHCSYIPQHKAHKTELASWRRHSDMEVVS